MIPPACSRAATGLRRTTHSNLPLTRAKPSAAPPLYVHLSGRNIRRPHITKATAALPDQTKTIPTPTTWLWLEPVARPFRAYGRVQQRRPYMTQFVSALVIYFVGDLVAQGIGAGVDAPASTIAEDEEEEEAEMGWVQAWAADRDWHRTGRALFIGGLAAVPGYRWFLWLGNNFNYRSKVLSLGTKVCVALSPLHPFPHFAHRANVPRCK